MPIELNSFPGNELERNEGYDGKTVELKAGFLYGDQTIAGKNVLHFVVGKYLENLLGRGTFVVCKQKQCG